MVNSVFLVSRFIILIPLLFVVLNIPHSHHPHVASIHTYFINFITIQKESFQFLFCDSYAFILELLFFQTWLSLTFAWFLCFSCLLTSKASI